MGLSKKVNFYMMDIIKFIFCFFIVGIHTEIFSNNIELHYWIEKGLFRLAVPYFVLCSGFLLQRKISEGGGKANLFDTIKHFSDRLMCLLIVFEPISLILIAIIYVREGGSISYITLRLIQSILFYPYGALWYIQAMIIGVWMLYYFVLRKNKIKYGGLIGGPLFLIALICNSYYFVVEDSLFGKVVDFCLEITVSARNGIFYGFFVLWIGMISYYFYEKKHITIKYAIIGFIICYLLYLNEIRLLIDKTMKDDGSIFLMSIPVAFFLLLISVNYKTTSKKTIILRNLSTGVYLLHRPLLYILTIMKMVCPITIGHEVQFFLVAGSAVLICLFIYKKNFWVAKYLK